LPRPRGLSSREKARLQSFVLNAVKHYGITRADIAECKLPGRLNSAGRATRNNVAYRISIINRLFTQNDTLSRETAHAIGVMTVTCPAAAQWRSDSRAKWRAARKDGNSIPAVLDIPMRDWQLFVDDVFPEFEYLQFEFRKVIDFPAILIPTTTVRQLARWINADQRARTKRSTNRLPSVENRLILESETVAFEVADGLAHVIAVALTGIRLPRIWSSLESVKRDPEGRPIPRTLFNRYDKLCRHVSEIIVQYRDDTQ